jgi:PST family polysaccharide transporter
MKRPASTSEARSSGDDPAIAPPAKRDTAAMDRHLLGGIFWTATAKWSSQVVSWGSLVVVARFVSPADFGLVAMAAVYLEVAKAVSQFGFGSAAITLRDLTDSEIRQINAFAVLAAGVMVALSCALAVPLGLFFHSPRLPPVVAVMSITMLTAGVQTIPYSLLQRDFRFKLLSATQTSGALVQALCTLVLACLGFGYWALVVGSVTGAVVSAALPIVYAPRGFAWPRSKSIHHALRFSWEVLVAHLTWSFYTNADFLIAGRLLGAGVLGEYGLAQNLATMPVEKVTALVGQVTPAVFSARQTDQAELRRYLLLLTEGLSVVTFPMGIGIALTAPDFVPLVFGKAWIPAIVPLQILIFFGCARSVSAVLGPLLTAVRDTRYVMLNNLSAAVFMPLAFYVGSRWGAPGIAAAWVVAYPFILYSMYGRVFRMIGLSVRTYFKALAPAISGVMVMALLVELVRISVLRGRAPGICVAVEIALGAAGYVAALLVLHAERVRTVAQWYRRMRAGGSPAMAPQ